MKLVPHTFENRLNGLLGEFWVKDAQNEIAKAKADYESGRITIDDKGVARNCIGRVLMDDLAEVMTYVTDKIDRQATAEAREEEVHREIEEYRKNPPKMTEEDLLEMRAAFGPGEEVVDIFTGKVYYT